MFDRGIHDDVPDPGLVYLCSTYPAAVRLKDSLDFVRAQGNEPDRHALGTYRMVDGYCIMGGLDEVPLADAYAVDAALIEDWGVGDAVFRITDLKAKTFSYAVDADGGQKASTLVYYTDEGSDPVLFQQTGGGWRATTSSPRTRSSKTWSASIPAKSRRYTSIRESSTWRRRPRPTAG